MAGRVPSRRNSSLDYLTPSDSEPDGASDDENNETTGTSLNNTSQALQSTNLGTSQTFATSIATSDPVPNTISNPATASANDAVVSDQTLTTQKDDTGSSLNAQSDDQKKKSGGSHFFSNLFILALVGGLIYLIYWVIEELGKPEDETTSAADDGGDGGDDDGDDDDKPTEGNGNTVEEEEDSVVAGAAFIGIGATVAAGALGGIVIYRTEPNFQNGYMRAFIMTCILLFSVSLFFIGSAQFNAGSTGGGNFAFYMVGWFFLVTAEIAVDVAWLADPYLEAVQFTLSQFIVGVVSLIWVVLAANQVGRNANGFQVANTILSFVNLLGIIAFIVFRFRARGTYTALYEQMKENLEPVSVEARLKDLFAKKEEYQKNLEKVKEERKKLRQENITKELETKKNKKKVFKNKKRRKKELEIVTKFTRNRMKKLAIEKSREGAESQEELQPSQEELSQLSNDLFDKMKELGIGELDEKEVKEVSEFFEGREVYKEFSFESMYKDVEKKEEAQKAERKVPGFLKKKPEELKRQEKNLENMIKEQRKKIQSSAAEAAKRAREIAEQRELKALQKFLDGENGDGEPGLEERFRKLQEGAEGV